MENKEIKIPKSKFKICIKILLELENLFNKYNQKSESKKIVYDSGYLIDKKYFDNFKNRLNYSIFKSMLNNDYEFKSKFNELYRYNKEIKLIPCEQKIFSNSKDLCVSLSLNNEYVIINTLLWKMINNGKYNEDAGKINFEIKDNKIILHFGNDDDVYFKYNSNIITNKNLLIINDCTTTQKINHQRNKSVELLINQDINNKISKEKLINKENKNLCFKDKIKEVSEIQNEKEINKNHSTEKENNDINYLIELYYAFDNLNFHIKDANKILKSQENYYLINKEWINYLNKCYNYGQISQAINNCEKNKDLICKYREKMNIENEFDSNDINYIFSRIPLLLMDDIKNNDKAYDINLYKSFEKRIKEGNEEVYYYDECILINEKIKNILININGINDKFDKQINCFISAHNIYLCYQLKNNKLISIGKIDENDILKINILVTLDNDYYYSNYMQEIIINGKVPNIIYQLKQEKQKVKILYNNEYKKIGHAFILCEENEENNSSSKIQRSKNIVDESKSQNKKEKQLEAMNQLVKEEMKSMLKFHIFNKKLIEHLEPSKFNNNGIFFDNSTKYYLISDKFMNKFRSLYPVNELFN